MGAATPVGPLGQHDRQLAGGDSRAAGRDVECALQTHGTCETAELTLHEVERLVVTCGRRRLLPGHNQHVVSEEDSKRLRRDAADVDDNFNSPFRLDDVERRMAFTRRCTMLPGKTRRKVVEQAPDVIGELRSLGGGNEGELRHWAMFSHVSVPHVGFALMQLSAQRGGHCRVHSAFHPRDSGR